MKLFKWFSNDKKQNFPQVDQVEIKEQVGISKETIAIAKAPRLRNPALSFKLRSGTEDFEQPEYDLAEIGRIEDVDSYVQRAFTLKEGLMFKEGWELVGKNQKTIKYIKTRFEQISIATGIPIQILIRGMGADLIRVSNVYIAKVRNAKSSGGRSYVGASGKQFEPVAGYFPLPASSVRIKRDDFGKVEKYRQLMPSGVYKDFNPDEIIHIFFNKKKGFLVGTPTLISVKDDIRALRRIEENIEMLIYQTLFPIYHYTVGTEKAPSREYPDGTTEISIVKSELEYMPAEGMIVTPERHNITAIGAEGRALRAEGYIDHFKRRVIAGLGISALDLGEGDCHDFLTEVLTESGWKYFDQLDYLKEKIAVYNPDLNQIEFQFANSKYEKDYYGDMIVFKGKHLDIKVTPNHDMWIAPRNSKKLNWQKVKAIDLYNGKYNNQYAEFFMLESESFENSNPEQTIKLETIAKNGHGRVKCFEVPTKDFASLLGYYLAEGCLDKTNHRLKISQNKGKILDKITILLQQLGISYSFIKRNNRKNESGITIYTKAIYEFFAQNVSGLAAHKFIPSFVWSWSKQAQHNLLEALLDGDGSRDKRKGRTNKSYYTTSLNLANDVQRLALTLGYAAKVSLCKQSKKAHGKYIYRVLISKHNIRLVTQKNISKESYSGKIYCLNVPHHLFLTRRNGKVTIQGNSANRSTSDNMSRNLVDDVKHYQRTLEIFINEFVIKELLMESTFENVLAEENLVSLKFNEIDLDAKIKVENHAIQAFSGHSITHDEMRRTFGREPLSKSEWENMYWKLIMEPEMLIRAVDEPYTAISKAVARNKNTSIEQSDLDEEQAAKEQIMEKENELEIKKQKAKPKPKIPGKKPTPKKTSGQRAAAGKDRPSNQHGTNAGPTKRKTSYDGPILLDNTNPLLNYFNELRGQIGYMFQTNNNNPDILKQNVLQVASRIQTKLERTMRLNFAAGMRSINVDNAESHIYAHNDISKRVARLVSRFATQVIDNLTAKNYYDSINILDSMFYRLDYMWTTENLKAYNYGIAKGLRYLKKESVEIIHDDECCAECTKVNKFNLLEVSLDDMPSFHPNCKCMLSTKL